MTKQEAIEQAIKKHYGRYYEFVEYHHDEWGWVNEKWLENTDFKSNVEYERYADLIKPIALKGIENNNGWIKIESIDDLPKVNMENKDDKYWTFRDSLEIGQLPLSWLHTFKQMEKENKTNSIITHYQPIITPEPPIY